MVTGAAEGMGLGLVVVPGRVMGSRDRDRDRGGQGAMVKWHEEAKVRAAGKRMATSKTQDTAPSHLPPHRGRATRMRGTMVAEAVGGRDTREAIGDEPMLITRVVGVLLFWRGQSCCWARQACICGCTRGACEPVV